MSKRKFVALFEMFLLVSFSFAVAFIFSEYVGVVSGQTAANQPATLGSGDWSLDLAGGKLYGSDKPVTIQAPASDSTGLRLINPTDGGSPYFVDRNNNFVGYGGGAIDSTVGATASNLPEGVLTVVPRTGDPALGIAVTKDGGFHAVEAMQGGGWTSVGGQYTAAELPSSLVNGLGSVEGITPEALKAAGWTEHSFGMADKGVINGLQSPDMLHGVSLDGGGSVGNQLSFDGSANAWKGASSPAGQQSFFTGSGPGTIKGIFQGQFFGAEGFAGGLSALTGGLVWGGIVYGGVKLIGSLFGLEDGLTDALAGGGFWGTFTGTTLYFLGNNGILAKDLFLVQYSAWVGIGVGALVFVFTYEKEKKEIVRFECLPWEPPTGGQNCEKCNDNEFMPCSEYRCRSLGQACELVNEGTGEEKCVWKDKNDVSAPVISPSDEALSEGLRYVRQSDGAFKITDIDGPSGCLEPFTTFDFGITTNEISKCRTSFVRTESFSDMIPFDDTQSTVFREEHEITMPVVDVHSQEDNPDIPSIHSDGLYTLYMRCIDANGNGEDSAETAFRFCVAKGSDLSNPAIMGTSIKSGSYVGYDTPPVPIEVYVNKPAECRWSRQDKSYDVMDNEMRCSTDFYNVNEDYNYVCKSELTGIVNREDNMFYFRCKDHPGEPEENRHVTLRSYPLLLKGTEELTITSVGPEGTISGGADVVSVVLTAETAHGAEDGKATCGYSLEEEIGTFVDMDETQSHEHSQEIFRNAGNYRYFIRCRDAGNNVVMTSTSFTVVVDKTEPEIARAFRDADKLKIITQESASCAYSTTNCNFNFDDGEVVGWVDPVEKNVHSVSWNPDVTYYVICKDENGRQPSPGSCSIVLQGSEF